MTPSSSASSPVCARRRLSPRRPWLRVGLVLACVLAAHALIAQWALRYREPYRPIAPASAPVEVALLKPQRIERTPAPSRSARNAQQAAPAKASEKTVTKTAAAPQRAHAPHRSQRATTAHPAEPVLSVERSPATHAPTAPAAPHEAAPPAGTSASGSAAHGAAAAGAGAANGTGQGGASKGVRFSLPPSGLLQYDTYYNGVRNEVGTIHWRTDGHSYDLWVSMPVPFVGPYSYESHGRIDAYGIAPDQYIEQRGRRPADFAIFNRETKQIVFTRTPNSVALPDGAQDRFSMLIELSGLVRGDPDAYRPGVTREFFVVDNDSSETWPITTIGDETVRTDSGFVDARHFMRLPRRDGDRRRIDIWLAPSLGWLPVRMVQTEPNGSQIELVWRGRAPAPGAEASTTEPAAAAQSEASAAPAPGGAPAVRAPTSASRSANPPSPASASSDVSAPGASSVGASPPKTPAHAPPMPAPAARGPASAASPQSDGTPPPPR